MLRYAIIAVNEEHCFGDKSTSSGQKLKGNKKRCRLVIQSSNGMQAFSQLLRARPACRECECSLYSVIVIINHWIPADALMMIPYSLRDYLENDIVFHTPVGNQNIVKSLRLQIVCIGSRKTGKVSNGNIITKTT